MSKPTKTFYIVEHITQPEPQQQAGIQWTHTSEDKISAGERYLALKAMPDTVAVCLIEWTGKLYNKLETMNYSTRHCADEAKAVVIRCEGREFTRKRQPGTNQSEKVSETWVDLMAESIHWNEAVKRLQKTFAHEVN